MNIVKWPEITNFYNVRKLLAQYPELLRNNNNNNTIVTYRSKIKLHGTNAAIKVLADGTVATQSRTSIITPQNDNAGFAAWVTKHEDVWAKLAIPLKEVVVFGEWCGPGIQKGVAINQITSKIFAVFAIVIREMQLYIVNPLRQDFLVDPNIIKNVLTSVPENTYILPWYQAEIKINWNLSVEDLQPEINKINQHIKIIEKCDPWVQETFGISGIGEGLVFYPISHPDLDSFSNLAFKAKGEEHKVVRTKDAVQADPEIVTSVSEFVSLVLTEARLEQGLQAINSNLNIKTTGQFVGWICNDVEKETKLELEASKLNWKQVQKAVANSARQWYINRINTIQG